MDIGRVKNIVILKNLPSNIVEEAFVVLKENKMAKNLQYIDKKSENEQEINGINKKEYIVREAEMLISEYIAKMEKHKNARNSESVIIKYKKIKMVTIFFGLLLLIDLIIKLIG